MKGHADCTGHVIVASPRGAQPVGRIGYELAATASGEHAQPFEDAGHIRSRQVIVAMLALKEHFH